MKLSKPNILMLMTDQHNPNVMGPHNRYGAETPSLDRLAGKSMVFTRAFCNSPICVPSRMSLMTGLFPQHHQVYDNGGSLPEGMPTYAHGLNQAGYETVICARMHFNGLDDHHGFEKRLMSEFCNPIEYPPPLPEWQGPIDPEYGGVGPREIPHVVNDSCGLYYDDDIAGKACDYLRGKSWGDRPFYLLTSFYGPHPYLSAREEYLPAYEKYLQEDLGVRELDQKEFEALPAHVRRIICGKNAKAQVLSKEAIQEYRAEYLARITYTDGLIGKVLDTLEEEGLSEDTIIIYLSDHGEQMGNHGICGKSVFYDDTVRVPLMISMPDRNGGPVQADVQLVDLFPTLLDMAGAPQPGYSLDGHSLMPLIENPDTEWNHPVFSAFFDAQAYRPSFMLKEGNWKYVEYPGESCFLYDQNQDPEEKINFALNPAFQDVVKRLQDRMLDICNPLLIEKEARIMQAKRRYAIQGTASSRLIKERMQKRIRDHRNSWNERYWDGNQKQSAHESFIDPDVNIDPTDPNSFGQKL